MTVQELIKMFKCNVNYEVFVCSANLEEEGEYSALTNHWSDQCWSKSFYRNRGGRKMNEINKRKIIKIRF